MSTETHADPNHVRYIHRQMRLDLTRYVRAVETARDADRAGRLRPLARWAVGFTRELHLHHTIEDLHFFPEIAARAPDVADVLAALEADHHEVAVLLERGAPAARELADPVVPFARTRDEVLEVAGRIRTILGPHLDTEDDEILPVVSERFTLEQYDELDQRVKRSLPKTGLSFAIPWNVGAMPEEERDALKASAPVALRMLYRLTNGRYERLVAAAFDGVPGAVAA